MIHFVVFFLRSSKIDLLLHSAANNKSSKRILSRFGAECMALAEHIAAETNLFTNGVVKSAIIAET